jgi:hypothetical protein
VPTCDHVQREPGGGYRLDTPPCGKPAVQFWLCHSNTVAGVTWTLACCEEHRMPLEPPDGVRYNDDSHEISEQEFLVAQVMQA